MSFWQSVKLVLKYWPYVVKFVSLISQKIDEGMNKKELEEGLRKLDEAFKKPAENVQDAASDAGSINDSFRV